MQYRVLLTNYLQWLIAVCQNIDSFKNVPASAKAGYKKSYRVALAGIDVRIKDANAIAVVPYTTVTQQLDQFLASRGIASKGDSELSSGGLLNLWNQLSIFTATKVRTVLAYEQTVPTVAYYPNATTFQSLNTRESRMVSASDVNDYITSLDALVKYQSTSRLIYTVTAVSSCSCSSSCSSSSSTSCSSCSLFIAYMKL